MNCGRRSPVEHADPGVRVRARISWFRKSWILVGAGLGLAIAGPPTAYRLFHPFAYNQLLVAQANLLHGRWRPMEWLDAFRSSWSAGLDVIARSGPNDEPRVTEPAGVFDWLPSRCVVYPTEGFYYFATTIHGRAIMGNVRIADLDRGELGSAYFTIPGKESWSFRARAADGLEVWRLGPTEVEVTWRGKSVTFVEPHWGTRPPDNLALLAEERFIGQVYDESAVQFFLLFNERTDSFYFVLNEEVGLNETLEPLREDVLVGRRSGFAFWVDPELDRKLLIGTALQHADRNDYFDGPQDQVPYQLDLRDRLHRAYPNTRLGAGIDAHGVYLNMPEWLRIAITPFLRYANLEELTARVDACAATADHGERLTCLTKEWWNTSEWNERIRQQLADEARAIDLPR